MRSGHNLTEKQVRHRSNRGKIPRIVKTAEGSVYRIGHGLMLNFPSAFLLVK